MAAVIELDRITLRHPNAPTPVMRGAALTIEEGSLVSVVGGSGVGKSTLLRAAAGLLKPEGGEVRTNTPAARDRRPNAMVFQDSRLLPWRRVDRNVALGLKGLDLEKGEAAERVAKALDLTGLSEFAHRWPHQLSGGQAQRVGIARGPGGAARHSADRRALQRGRCHHRQEPAGRTGAHLAGERRGGGLRHP